MAGTHVHCGRVVDLVGGAQRHEPGAGVIAAAELQKIPADGVSARRRQDDGGLGQPGAAHLRRAGISVRRAGQRHRAAAETHAAGSGEDGRDAVGRGIAVDDAGHSPEIDRAAGQVHRAFLEGQAADVLRAVHRRRVGAGGVRSGREEQAVRRRRGDGPRGCGACGIRGKRRASGSPCPAGRRPARPGSGAIDVPEVIGRLRRATCQPEQRGPTIRSAPTERAARSSPRMRRGRRMRLRLIFRSASLSPS